MKNPLSALTKRAKYVSLRDIIGIYKFLLVLIPSMIYGAYVRIRKKQLWLICEREDMARDNGFAFFEYMQKEHQELKTFYVIDKKNKECEKVEKYLSRVIQWASLKHYFYYMCATKNITSHKEGSPNQLVFTLLHLGLNLYNNRVFLQHGITKDDAPMFYYKKTKFKLFICGAEPEYKYVVKKFGYPNGSVRYTGFARYDKLENNPEGNIIAFIPTWRRWINDENYEESDYKKNILMLLNNDRMKTYLERDKKVLLFYPHINAQKYFKESDIKNKNVILMKKDDILIKDLVSRSSLLITDYSSISFDFAYLKKPVIYYHPDYDEYRKNHGLEEGYFSYIKDGFGPVVYDVDAVVDAIIRGQDSKYINNRNVFFKYNDTHNCDRIFKEIMSL